MPTPPKKDETEEEFMARCMSAVADEYDSHDQRVAVCMNMWRDRDKKDKNLGEPKTDEERAKNHFGISDEEWDNMTPEERQEKIDKLPPRGEARKTVKP